MCGLCALWEEHVQSQHTVFTACRKSSRSAGSPEAANALPGGLATNVGTNGKNLNGGLQQRVFIARTIARNAPMVIMVSVQLLQHMVYKNCSGHGDVKEFLVSQQHSSRNSATTSR